MEHSSHAHPPRAMFNGESTTNAAASQIPCPVTSSPGSIWANAPPNDGLSQQARRLQLRNVGFRASALPTRRISPLFGATMGSDTFHRSPNKENSPASMEKRAAYGENMPPSPVNILQELQNSARRKKLSPRPGIGGIFQDSISQETGGMDESSWYNETSNNCEPCAVTVSPSVSRLREVSGNQRPALVTPPSKYVKSRRVSRVKPRSVSSEVVQHIDYLERELELAKAKSEADASSVSKRKHSSMARELSIENNNLRHELDEWHKRDARVQQELEKRLVAESEMRDRLEALEAESDLKDRRIGDLEWEIECMKLKVRDAEGLDQVNVDLEKRIDVLSNLLVQSPMRLGTQSAVTSPNKFEAAKRMPRPQSMFSMAPPSPRRARLSLTTVSETALWESKPLASPLGRFQTDIRDGQQVASPESLQSPSPFGQDHTSYNGEQSATPECFGTRSRSSTGMRSAPSPASRPISLLSSSSFGGAPRAPPMLQEDDEWRLHNKKRRMRRFASGSKSLKPLVLPTTSNVHATPISAPVYPSIEDAAVDRQSGISLDPTKAFLSRLASSSPNDTPTQRPRRSSAFVGAHQDALRALEGTKPADATPSRYEPSSWSLVDDTPPKNTETTEASKSCEPSRSRPRSLHQELEEADSTQPGSGVSPDSREEPFANRQTSSAKDATPDAGKILIGLEAPSSQESKSNSNREPDRQPQTPKPAPQTPEFHSFNSPFRNSPIASKSPASSSLTSEEAHGIFTRLTTFISSSNKDPLDLARSLLSSAWSNSSNRLLGGVGWWLLGLIHYHLRRLPRSSADTLADNNATTYCCTVIATAPMAPPTERRLRARLSVAAFLR